jgi:hypothetical protein
MTKPNVRTEEERLEGLRLQEDHIGQMLRESEASGELRRAPSYGKPLAAAAGYRETPDELRMGMKILKDAGVVPPEVELMQRIAALQAEADACADEAAARALRQRVSELRQALALRLEGLRRSGTL